MFQWIGRQKRIEAKLDELLSYYGPRPAASVTPNYTPPGTRTDPIIMTEEREAKIMDQLSAEALD